MSAVEPHRAGFVALGGRSNVGKSTLVNRLVGRKVSIVSPRPQTTRRRILGIRDDPDAQMILIDTPGIHDAPRLLNRRMVATARRCLGEGEVVAGVLAAGDTLRAADRALLAELRGLKTARILVLNKIDLMGRARLLAFAEACHREMPEAEIVPVSALTGENVEELARTIKAMLPEGPSLMAADEYTDQSERTIAAEIVREKLFLAMRQEIPFSLEVEIEQFAEIPEKNLRRISALIIVERESHKAIVIGAGGGMLKDVGTRARLELERIFGTRVFLELVVRVEAGWTEDPRRLAALGL